MRKLEASQIADVLGGRRCGSGYVACCPVHRDSSPSLSVSQKDGRVLVHCHAGCSQSEVWAAILSLGDNCMEAFASTRTDRPDQTFDASKYISAILKCSRSIDHASASPLRKYLSNRGLSESRATKGLRYHPSLHYFEKGSQPKRLPAMLAEVHDQSGHRIALHRTYLTECGRKASVVEPKKVLGKYIGGAVKLTRVGPVLSLAEGIETALAVHEITQEPVWAAISANGLKRFVCPIDVQQIHIWADADKSRTGEKAAEELCWRLRLEGKQVFIHTPSRGLLGSKKSVDWLDVLNFERGVSHV